MTHMLRKGCSHVGWRDGLLFQEVTFIYSCAFCLCSPHSSVGVGLGLESMSQVGQRAGEGQVYCPGVEGVYSKTCVGLFPVPWQFKDFSLKQ